MRVEPVRRSTPMTLNRALTAIVQCRGRLEEAHRELSLAIEVVRRLSDDPGRGRDLNGLRLRDLSELLERLESSREAAARAIEATRSRDYVTGQQ